MAVDPKILARVKKCLALSKSSNPNEAANALKQAQALMAKHGVDMDEATAIEIGEADLKSRTMARDKPVSWELNLASMVASAFGCKMLLNRTLASKKGWSPLNDGHYKFIGLKHQAEIAAYTADTLVRRCKNARQEWLTAKLAGLGELKGGKKKMTELGNHFADGWVISIARQVTEFANPPEVDVVIENHVNAEKTGSYEDERKSPDRREKASQLAAHAGFMAAQDERLYRPVAGAESAGSIEK